ncbi:MAG TPA: metal-dependent hydrolase [Firmicutes bacterium]|nr:metal-dependent hydrolase [Bacillota bacterium]
MQVKYLGHACFLLVENDTAILVDPFLTSNPVATVKAADVTANYILVSHHHTDHAEDVAEIAQANGATVISTAEIAQHFADLGLTTHAMHIGGKHGFDFGYVRLTPALHGAGIAGGHACGFVINLFGTVIYHAGDTGLFGDMRLIGELEDLDLALLPIGDNFTMGVGDAVRAAALLRAPKVIPMHYNTWSLIKADPQAFKQQVEEETAAEVIILQPGEELEL